MSVGSALVWRNYSRHFLKQNRQKRNYLLWAVSPLPKFRVNYFQWLCGALLIPIWRCLPLQNQISWHIFGLIWLCNVHQLVKGGVMKLIISSIKLQYPFGFFIYICNNCDMLWQKENLLIILLRLNVIQLYIITLLCFKRIFLVFAKM